jgi:hypothetical protein
MKATMLKREQDWPERNRRTDALSSLANKLYLKVGDLAALDGDYQKAIQMFEKVAKHSADNNLMRVSLSVQDWRHDQLIIEFSSPSKTTYKRRASAIWPLGFVGQDTISDAANSLGPGWNQPGARLISRARPRLLADARASASSGRFPLSPFIYMQAF